MNSHYDIAQLRKYVNGDLSPQEMYAIERASHQDELLLDLIHGLEEEKQTGIPYNQQEIDTFIFQRVREGNENIKPIKPLAYYRWLSIAASIVLLAGIGTIWFLNRDVDQKVALEEMITHSPAPQDLQTDTTLNSIEVDTPKIVNPEQELIAMAAPSPQEKAKKQNLQKEEPIIRLKNQERRVAETTPDIRFGNPMEIAAAAPKTNNMLDEGLQGRVAGIQVEKEAPKSSIIIRGYSNANRSNIVGATKVSSPQDAKKLATGRVLDEKSGRPIVRASIRNVKTNELAMTDSLGQFVMPLEVTSSELEVLSLGYQSQRIIASNNKIIHLKPDFNDLDEVVIVGHSGKESKIKSEPLVGWLAYKKYINDNADQTLLGKGTVTLVFDINNFGRPMDITVKKSSSPDHDQRAIQIIQNGPDWKKGNDGKKIEVKITFK